MEKFAQDFFDKFMPIYAALVCIGCIALGVILLAVLAVSVLIRLFS